MVVGFIGDQEGAVFIAAQRFGALLGQHAAQKPNIPLRILGPAPMNITMLNNKFRYKLTLKCRNDAAFRALLHETLDAYDAEKLPQKAAVILDFNSDGDLYHLEVIFMALRTIVQDGDPILKKVCRPVTKFDDRLGTLLDDMKETLLAANGLGLAGPQVGMMRRLFICLDDRDLPEEVPANYEYKFIEFINPEILELSDEQVELYEGCLSFPGHNGAIKRSKHVKVKAQDRHGEWFELEADDMLARCIQHENNHLDGITIMDLAEHFYEDDYPEENED